MPFNLGKSRKDQTPKADPRVSADARASADAEDATSQEELAGLFGRAAAGDIDKDLIKQLTKAMKRSMKVSRKGVTVSGQGLSELLLKIAPRIPVRSYDELSQKSKGYRGEALGGYVVKRASRHSAAVGGLAGGIASAGVLAPPTWILLPAEILVETLLIAAIEVRMVAELHNVYGRPIEGTPEERGHAILTAWSARRGIDLEDVASGGLAGGATKGARTQLVHLIRRKLIARAARNISTVAPMLIGAAAAAELNRRATRDLGDNIVRDLGMRPNSIIDARGVEIRSTQKDPK